MISLSWFVTTDYFQCHGCFDYEITIFTATTIISFVVKRFTCNII
jgi:hypothetical protein